jgi:hypothetical protein
MEESFMYPILGGMILSSNPLYVAMVGFAAMNAISDYQSATQSAINDKNKVLGLLYGAGMSAAI